MKFWVREIEVQSARICSFHYRAFNENWSWLKQLRGQSFLSLIKLISTNTYLLFFKYCIYGIHFYCDVRKTIGEDITICLTYDFERYSCKNFI